MINRKEFLQKSAALAGAAVVSHPLLSWAENTNQSKKMLFDFHCHPAMFFANEGELEQQFSAVISAMNAAKFNGAFLSIVSDWTVLEITNAGVIPTRKLDKLESWNEYKRQLSIIANLVSASNSKLASDVDHLSRRDNVNFFLSVEGADFLENDIDNVDRAYEDGVRSIQLVHYAPNGLGDLQTSEPTHNGLSDFGNKVVKRMSDLGVLIDVAHASFETVVQVAEMAGVPLLLSHSMLTNGSQSPVSNRTISKEHAIIVAETGGVIGAWPSGYSSSLEDFAENTIRLIDIVGVEHVGLGTDMDANYKPVMANYSRVEEWTKVLRSKGLSKEEVNKVSGGNAERLLKAVLR